MWLQHLSKHTKHNLAKLTIKLANFLDFGGFFWKDMACKFLARDSNTFFTLLAFVLSGLQLVYYI